MNSSFDVFLGLDVGKDAHHTVTLDADGKRRTYANLLGLGFADLVGFTAQAGRADPPDIVAIERTREYRGRYHVLQGAISPIDGIGPDDLELGAALLWQALNASDEEISALRAV